MAAETIVTIVLALQNNPEAIADRYVKGYHDPKGGYRGLADLILAISSGNEIGKAYAFVDKGDGTEAAQTCAITYANVDAGDTVTICGVVFTARASATGVIGDFYKQTDATVTGDNLAAAINAHPALKGLCSAVNAVGTLTITMGAKAVAGNNGTIATSDATAFTLGAASFASGAKGTVQSQIRCYGGGLA